MGKMASITKVTNNTLHPCLIHKFPVDPYYEPLSWFMIAGLSQSCAAICQSDLHIDWSGYMRLMPKQVIIYAAEQLH